MLTFQAKAIIGKSIPWFLLNKGGRVKDLLSVKYMVFQESKICREYRVNVEADLDMKKTKKKFHMNLLVESWNKPCFCFIP